MKNIKRLASLIIAFALIMTSLPFTITTASAAPDISANSSLAIRRPMAIVNVTDVTRVAYAVNSMRSPSGSNSVIVKATPSGIPELGGAFASSIAYAGETPVATQIAFTPGVELSEAPKISCNNTTVTISDYSYSNGTYIWSVLGGTATVGTTLLFSVSYTYTDYNQITGKEYKRLYETHGTSYVEAISVPSGLYSYKRTYEDFFFGQSNKNKSYLATYILGSNTYGSFYDGGTGTGSIDFESTGSAPGWTTSYGMMKNFDGHSANRDLNVGYAADYNRPLSYVYFDRSIHSTLSDLNLRLVASIVQHSDVEAERVTVTLRNTYANLGITGTYSGDSDDGEPFNHGTAVSQLGMSGYSGSIYNPGEAFPIYFTGTGPSDAVGTYDYTVTAKYKTSAQWNEVFVGHSHSLEIIVCDKGALRTLVEGIRGTDPSVITTDIGIDEFKGYNPQSWYYSAGWENFFNAYKAATSCLNKPNASQSEIDEKYTALRDAYNSLVMRTADYSVTSTYYNQAISKNRNNYTLSSWAKVQNILDNYIENISSIYQPAADKLGLDLKAAMDALEEAQADYSLFNRHLGTINNLIKNCPITYGRPVEDCYNNWDKLVSVLVKSGCVYDELDGFVVAEPLLISDQATVNGYVILLERALDAITLKAADFTRAAQSEAAYKRVELSHLVEDSAAQLTAAYNELVALKGKDLSYQKKIDEATAKLDDILNRLVYKPADTNAAYDVLAVAYGLDRSIYDDLSAVDAAVSNLEAKLDLDIRYQNDINRAVSALDSAINSLLKNAADYSIVDDAIAAVQEHEKEIAESYAAYGFTAETFYSNWSKVQAAIQSVVRGLDFTYQETVNAYAADILSALTSLTENTADYTRVRELQDEAYGIVQSGSGLYTEASLDNLTIVYASVINNKPISEQATVDSYADSIQTAIDELEYLSADYSKVAEQLALAQAELERDEAYSQAHPGYTYYTPDSLSQLNVAIAAVVDGLDIRYQSEVNGYASTIAEAIIALECAPADYTQVDLKLLEIPEDLSLYTSLSVATLNATVKTINRTYTADKQSTVDRYVTTIGNAIKSLKYKSGDYTAVNAALAKVPSDSSPYTQDSWNYLQEQISAVVYGLDVTHQSEIDVYALAIEQAIEFLVLNKADYTDVENAIARARAEIATGRYTAESVALLEQAISAVVYDLPLDKQSEVQQFADDIVNLTNELKLILADYTELQKILDLLDNSSSEIYTNTYKNFNEVMSLIVSYRENTVSKNMELPLDSQALVDEMTATLQGYIDSLEPLVERFELKSTAKVKTQGGVNYIYGLQTNLTKVKFQSTYVDYEGVKLEYEMTTSRYLGTGSKVIVRSESGNLIAEYIIIIYGDVDGSATINSKDSLKIADSLIGGAVLTGASKMAANVEGTRVKINDKDIAVINSVVADATTIDQVTGKTVN
ncbi:MAG: hypothetical protein IIU80_00705 [Clostridia bacterium]|nr:hypothetical protein [Clostridia bacterium]